MRRRKIAPPFSILLIFTLVSVVTALLAPQAYAQESWLDRSLVNWNAQAGRFPQLPQPAPSEPTNTNPCRQQLRQPASVVERALVRRGWMLYGPVYSYDSTTIVTALSGFDGMCRPIGFQGFVYWGGRYAGTLSPVPMDSRADGSLTDLHLTSATSLSAEFARYKESDPLCCPSRFSSVVYNLRRDNLPRLTPASVTHLAACQTSDAAISDSVEVVPAIFGKRWTLIEMEGRKISAAEPYIEFDRDQKRVSGSGGCNRFSGAFEMEGSELKLSRLLSTKRACLDTERQWVETRFLQLLEKSTRFEVQENTLRIYTKDGSALVFARRQLPS